MLANQQRSAALQHLLDLPWRRTCTVAPTDYGSVRIDITNPRTGELIAWMEMDCGEADLLAGCITATVTEIVGRRKTHG